MFLKESAQKCYICLRKSNLCCSTTVSLISFHVRVCLIVHVCVWVCVRERETERERKRERETECMYFVNNSLGWDPNYNLFHPPQLYTILHCCGQVLTPQLALWASNCSHCTRTAWIFTTHTFMYLFMYIYVCVYIYIYIHTHTNIIKQKTCTGEIGGIETWANLVECWVLWGAISVSVRPPVGPLLGVWLTQRNHATVQAGPP